MFADFPTEPPSIISGKEKKHRNITALKTRISGKLVMFKHQTLSIYWHVLKDEGTHGEGVTGSTN